MVGDVAVYIEAEGFILPEMEMIRVIEGLSRGVIIGLNIMEAYGIHIEEGEIKFKRIPLTSMIIWKKKPKSSPRISEAPLSNKFSGMAFTPNLCSASRSSVANYLPLDETSSRTFKVTHLAPSGQTLK
ncbi:MAG: hypothetical protein QXK12_07410 [Candidatus Nezhaarchaeales archaeon]